jgi:deazaflavin-dependent oxidoreductase (nitroreductase family)
MTLSPFAEQLVKLVVQGHIALYRLTKGWGPLGNHTILVTTIGRKSGQPRTRALISLQDGDSYILIASYGGADKDPDWYRNLQKNPHVSVEDHDRVIPTIASTVEDDTEYRRLWQKMNAIYGSYDGYQRNTERKIPVVRLQKQG